MPYVITLKVMHQTHLSTLLFWPRWYHNWWVPVPVSLPQCLNFPCTHLRRHKICWSGCCRFQWDNEGGALWGVQIWEMATMVPAWCLRVASPLIQCKSQFQCTQGHHRSKVSHPCLNFDWTLFDSNDTSYNAVMTLPLSPVSLLEMLGRLWWKRWSQLFKWGYPHLSFGAVQSPRISASFLLPWFVHLRLVNLKGVICLRVNPKFSNRTDRRRKKRHFEINRFQLFSTKPSCFGFLVMFLFCSLPTTRSCDVS